MVVIFSTESTRPYFHLTALRRIPKSPKPDDGGSMVRPCINTTQVLALSLGNHIFYYEHNINASLLLHKEITPQSRTPMSDDTICTMIPPSGETLCLSHNQHHDVHCPTHNGATYATTVPRRIFRGTDGAQDSAPT